MQRIPGWFSLSDQKVFEHFLSSQVLGNLLEVGVYMGKSAIFMENYRKPGEELHAHTPGVAAAMWEKVVGLELKPVLITNFKAYLSSPKNEFQLSKIQVELMSIGLKTEIVNAMGFEFIRVLSDEKDFGSTRFQIIRRVSPPFVIDLLSYLRWKIRGNS